MRKVLCYVILVPALAGASGGPAKYFFPENTPDATPPSSSGMRAVLDALHRYYDQHRRELAAAAVSREAARAARAQWLKDHPPVQAETVIHFWRRESGDFGTGGQP